MRKLKVALFASSILGMLAVSSYTAADTENNQVTISHYNEQAGTFDVNACLLYTSQVMWLLLARAIQKMKMVLYLVMRDC